MPVQKEIIFMVKFIGEYTGKIDDKGRVVFPSSFKSLMSAGCDGDMRLVVRKDIYEPCLEMYVYEEWQRQSEEVREKLNFFDASHARFWRAYMQDRAEDLIRRAADDPAAVHGRPGDQRHAAALARRLRPAIGNREPPQNRISRYQLEHGEVAAEALRPHDDVGRIARRGTHGHRLQKNQRRHDWIDARFEHEFADLSVGKRIHRHDAVFQRLVVARAVGLERLHQRLGLGKRAHGANRKKSGGKRKLFRHHSDPLSVFRNDTTNAPPGASVLPHENHRTVAALVAADRGLDRAARTPAKVDLPRLDRQREAGERARRGLPHAVVALRGIAEERIGEEAVLALLD